MTNDPKHLTQSQFIRTILTEEPLVFHATNKNFDQLDPEFGEFGSHVGTTKRQVGEIIPHTASRLHTLYASYKDKLRLPDFGTWDPMRLLCYMVKNKILTTDDLVRFIDSILTEHPDMKKNPDIPSLGHRLYNILNSINHYDYRTSGSAEMYDFFRDEFYKKAGMIFLDDKTLWRFIRELLMSKGYNGIVYLNRYEGIGGDKSSHWDQHLKLSVSDKEFKKEYPLASDSFILFNPYGEMAQPLPVRNMPPKMK
jgi:hypothetical protein